MAIKGYFIVGCILTIILFGVGWHQLVNAIHQRSAVWHRIGWGLVVVIAILGIGYEISQFIRLARGLAMSSLPAPASAGLFLTGCGVALVYIGQNFWRNQSLGARLLWGGAFIVILSYGVSIVTGFL
ncbi:hypothetical protein [Levilactobacillus bambusae]|uniref:Uncharacterized protein n=1 Tax=Levilactobacillus bambusae TaxID=2024736 RepID=A0A2V1N0M6_9LACO|nr:hypothetical protein [Levilactobacillus bambusae]PWF99899.1 hypothetical protein DCM90_02810 [Levilactobacillus bambusae]